MSPDHSLIAFVAAASLLTITPGVDTALVLRTAATEGPRAAWHASVGIIIGCLTWGAAAAIGVGGLVAASEDRLHAAQVGRRSLLGLARSTYADEAALSGELGV